MKKLVILSRQLYFLALLPFLMLVLACILFFWSMLIDSSRSAFFAGSESQIRQAEIDFQNRLSKLEPQIKNLCQDFILQLKQPLPERFYPKSMPGLMPDNSLNSSLAIAFRKELEAEYQKKLRPAYNRMVKKIKALDGVFLDDEVALFTDCYITELFHLHYKTQNKDKYRFSDGRHTHELSMRMNPELVAPGGISFIMDMIQDLLSRDLYSPFISPYFIKPSSLLYGLDIQNLNGDFNRMHVMGVHALLSIHAIEASTRDLELFYDAEILALPYNANKKIHRVYLATVLNMPPMFRRNFQQFVPSTGKYRMIANRELESLTNLKEQKKIYLLDPVSLVIEKTLTTEEIAPLLKTKSLLKLVLELPSGKKQYLTLMVDKVMQEFIHCIEVDPETLMAKSLYTILLALALSILVIYLFWFILARILHSLTKAMQEMSHNLSTLAKDILKPGLEEDSARLARLDFPLQQGPMELRLLSKSIQGEIQNLKQDFDYLIPILELLKKLSHNEDDFALTLEPYLKTMPLPDQGARVSLSLIRKGLNETNFQMALRALGQFHQERINLKKKEEIALQKEIELTLAAQVQKAMLPDKNLFAALKEAAYCEPATSLGGDFYDRIEKDGCFFYIIGDVAGKGLGAALYGACVSSLLRSLLISGCGLETSVQKAGPILAKRTPENYFCTLFLLEIKNSNARFISAGHNHMILLRQQKIIWLDSRGLPLGLYEIPNYPLVQIPLLAGDRILLYTDGVIERENLNMELFGMQRFQEQILATAHLSVAEQLDHITQILDQFSAGAPPSDDTTLMIISIE